MVEPHLRITTALGAGQTLAWASSYYLLAVLAEPIGRELTLPLPLVFAAFSLALVVSACTGPWAGRTIDRLGGRHPLLSARLAALGHPAGALLLFTAGAAAAPAFAILHGMGNGIMTIANGALPLALFGAAGYDARQGWLMLPARMAQAASPFVFGLALERWGSAALWATAALGLASAGLLLSLGRHGPDGGAST